MSIQLRAQTDGSRGMWTAQCRCSPRKEKDFRIYGKKWKPRELKPAAFMTAKVRIQWYVKSSLLVGPGFGGGKKLLFWETLGSDQSKKSVFRKSMGQNMWLPPSL